MPAERASVPQPSLSITQQDRDIHLGARPGLRLSLILVASFMVVLDFTIVNIALPSIERDFSVTTSVAQWVVTGYAIAFSGLLILGGRAADLLGRRGRAWPASPWECSARGWLEGSGFGFGGAGTAFGSIVLTAAIAALAATAVAWNAARSGGATLGSAA